MTIHFNAHFQNGVLIPDEEINLPVDRTLSVSVDEASGTAPAQNLPRYDDPRDPMPEGGLELVNWWASHRLPIDPDIGDKIARAKAYGYYEEPDDDS